MRRCLILLVLLVTSCVAIPRTYIHDARRLHPEGWYKTLFAAAESCVALGRMPRDIDFEDLEWYVVEHDAIEGVAGLYSPPDRIFLDANFVLNGLVVYHEALHALVNTSAADNDTTFLRCIQVANDI